MAIDCNTIFTDDKLNMYDVDLLIYNNIEQMLIKIWSNKRITMKMKIHNTIKVYTTTRRPNATHFLIPAFMIRYKGCVFVFECCWNAFLQFMVYLSLLLMQR